MNKDKITKEQIQRFDKVRKSGITNMYDVRLVAKLSNLSIDDVQCIIDNAEYLYNKYLS